MPFTFAHPAVILPAKKMSGGRLSLTGLVVGSLSPDFEYFLRLKMFGVYGHTLWGVLLFCVPISLIVCYLFHQIIKKPCIYNLPHYIQRKSADILALKWHSYCKRNYIWVVVSIIIGAYSHIIWDSFTHSSGYAVMLLGYADTMLFGLPVYKVSQYSSGLIGGLAIVIYIFFYKPGNKTILHKPHLLFWLLCLLVFAILLAIRLYCNPQMILIGHLVVNALALGFVALVLISSMTFVINKTLIKTIKYH